MTLSFHMKNCRGLLNNINVIKFYKNLMMVQSRDSVVGTVTRIRSGRCGVRITAGVKDFTLLHKRSNRLQGATSLLWVTGLFSGDKAAGA